MSAIIKVSAIAFSVSTTKYCSSQWLIVCLFPGVVTDKTILVSEGIGLESSTVLTQNDEKILKLPVKCPVPGRPKGKRHTAKSTQESRTSGHEEDVDDPG